MVEDNAGGVGKAEEGTSDVKLRHVDIKHHYTREQVQAEAAVPVHGVSQEHPADLLTKIIGINTFHIFRVHIMGL